MATIEHQSKVVRAQLRICVIGRGSSHSFAGLIASEFRLLGHAAEVIDVRSGVERQRGRVGSVASATRKLLARVEPKQEARLGSEVARTLTEVDPHLVITTLGATSRWHVERWRTAAPRARVVLWFPDHLANFGNQSALIAGFDRIYVKDRYIIDRLGSRGGVKELRYLPEGASSEIPPEWDRPMSPTEQQDYPEKVVLVGNMYPSRVRLLEALPADIQLALYGTMKTSRPPESIARAFTGSYITGEKKHRVFRYSQAVLNNLHFAEVQSVNFRLFDAASAGGLIVTEDLPAVCEFFDPGDEVLVYQNMDELVDLLRSTNDDLRVSVGSAAQQRVRRDHTLDKRLTVMLHDLGLE